MKSHLLFRSAILLLLTAACSVAKTQAPTPSSLPPPNVTGGVTPPTPYPLASGSLSADGPWWLVFAEDGFWAVNPDGSGLTHFDVQPSHFALDLSAVVAPIGGHVAFILADIRPTLELLTLPDGNIQTVSLLTAPATDLRPDSQIGDPDNDIFQAIATNSVAWSPDGRRLAFVGAQDGPTADLYMYSLDNDRVTRLNDLPTQSSSPSWSPDGEHVVYQEIGTFGNNGPDIKGIWAAHVGADRAETKLLYSAENSKSDILLGWFAPHTFLTHSWQDKCGPMTLRAVDAETGEARVLWDGLFNSVAFDSNSGAVMVSVGDTWANFCNLDHQPGAYLMTPDGVSARKISDKSENVIWSAEAGVFLVGLGEDKLATVSLTGEIGIMSRPAPFFYPSISGDAGQWAWWNWGWPGLWVGPASEPRQVFAGIVSYTTWGPETQTLLFFGGEEQRSLTLYAARSPEFSPVPVVGNMHGAFQTTWVNK